MKRTVLWAIVLAASAASPLAAQQRSLAEDAAAFGSRRAAGSVRISPDGNSLLYLTPGVGTETAAVLTNLTTGQSKVLVRSDGKPESLSGCMFTASDRIVCTIFAIVDTIGYMLPITRTVSMDLQGGDAKLLGRPSRPTDAGLRFSDGTIIDRRNAQDGKVLMIREFVPDRAAAVASNKDGLAVELVDTKTLRATLVEPPNPNASGYMSDYRGNVRVMSVPEKRAGDYTGKIKYFYRPDGSKGWKELVSYQKESFSPEAIDPTINALYALKEKDGRNALYAIALDGSGKETLVAADKQYDIGGGIQDGQTKKVIGYTVDGERVDNVYVDPEFKALAAGLARALPKSPIINYVDVTPDGRKILIVAASDDDPGRYYIYDKVTKALEPTLSVSPQLDGLKLAKMKMVMIPIGEGKQIPAYLTLPPGKEGKNLPAIVMPHGGPTSRDYWGFDWLSQFFAQRGYAVIQPQFRGSTGFGKAHQNDNAMRNWRAAMSDVIASGRWMASQGIADPKRLAIFGWSYGGYAALQSAALDPDLFNAVIAVAPVTDFALLKQAYDNNTMINDMLGSTGMAAASPLQNADRIKVPVLLVHGDTDINVKIEHADKMYSALKARGKQVEYLRYKGLDHQLPDPVARAEMLKKSAELLERTIGK